MCNREIGTETETGESVGGAEASERELDLDIW